MDDLLDNIDFETNTYNLNGLKLKFRDLSVSEYEALQDNYNKVLELEGKEMKASKATELEREWYNMVLTTAFGKDVSIDKIKSKCNIKEFNKLITEAYIFLAKISIMEDPKGYILGLRAKNQSLKKTKG